MATASQLLLVMVGLLIGIGSFWYGSIKNAEKGVLVRIFVLGILGWTGALLLRLVPLSIMQVVTLLYLGANFNNAKSVAQLATHPLVTMWGPIFAALFEEGIRYIIIVKYGPMEKDLKLSPLSLGLGWSTAEILLIYGSTIIALILNPQLQEFSDWFLVLAGGFERISATIFHVAMSFLVLQARREQFPKITSLWLAMLFHFAINALIIAWQLSVVPFIDENQLLQVWSLEITIAAITIGILVFITKFWVSRKKGVFASF